MKIKLESSKYDFKTKEEEANFKFKIKKSLDIDIEKFEFNAGLRSLAKICLNSLWGRFGMRNNMSQMKYVTEVSDQFVNNSKNTNVYIACFTTSHARLMLYNELDYLKEKVLYFETDSIVYADDGTKNVKTGDMLGDMTDEISGKRKTNFVSTGPESNSFK